MMQNTSEAVQMSGVQSVERLEIADDVFLSLQYKVLSILMNGLDENLLTVWISEKIEIINDNDEKETVGQSWLLRKVANDYYNEQGGESDIAEESFIAAVASRVRSEVNGPWSLH